MTDIEGKKMYSRLSPRELRILGDWVLEHHDEITDHGFTQQNTAVIASQDLGFHVTRKHLRSGYASVDMSWKEPSQDPVSLLERQINVIATQVATVLVKPGITMAADFKKEFSVIEA